MKVFLGDLVHDWNKNGVWTMPLNLGFIAGYAKTSINELIDFSLFKSPSKMIDAIRSEEPDVVALSYYVWNENLNHKILKIAKDYNSEILTIGGGPRFTSQNANEDGAIEFFNKQPECDVYIVNQGEIGFTNTLQKYLDNGCSINKLKKDSINGVLINSMQSYGRPLVGSFLNSLNNLDEIPSPYLDGLMDEFFNENYMPIIETNRSCPFRCTFCAWGIGTEKIAKFEDNRVFEEINYIANKAKNVTSLFIADANFGILERDAGFAKKIYEGYERTGFPNHVAVQWSKTRSDRVLKTAENFNGIAPIGASMQSLNDDVLKIVKRKNLPLKTVYDLHDKLSNIGIKDKLFSELIIGLPHETKRSHIDANRKLINLGSEIWNYNLHLLPGTEMDSKESRKNYFKKVGWRLHDNAFGIYDGEKIFEGQETVLKTSTLSINDFKFLRFWHLLQQMMWSKKWYRSFLMLLNKAGFHQVDVFTKIVNKAEKDSGEIGKLYQDFMEDYELENFETFKNLTEYWEKKENFNRLNEGSYGKLNFLYTYKIVLENRQEFDEFLLKLTEEISRNQKFLSQCSEILRFEASNFVRIDTSTWKVVDARSHSFNYDILGWKDSSYKGELHEVKVNYNFYLSKRQKKVLNRQLSQFKSDNLNSTMRNMSTYTDSKQFFYNVNKI